MRNTLYGEGINGEVFPCPDCGEHSCVKWLDTGDYTYRCVDCDTTFSKHESVTENGRGSSGGDQ